MIIDESKYTAELKRSTQHRDVGTTSLITVPRPHPDEISINLSLHHWLSRRKSGLHTHLTISSSFLP